MMQRDYQNLVLRFKEVREAYAQAKTPEEKRESAAKDLNVSRQAVINTLARRDSTRAKEREPLAPGQTVLTFKPPVSG